MIFTCTCERGRQVPMVIVCVCASAGVYPLQSINKRLVEIIGACYSDNGVINGKAAVYSPYSSMSEDLCSFNTQV